MHSWARLPRVLAMLTISANDRQGRSNAKWAGPRHPLLFRNGPIGPYEETLPLQDRSDTLRQNSTGEHSMRRLWTVLAALATLSLTNCGYNAIQTTDEQVKSGWSEVVN